LVPCRHAADRAGAKIKSARTEAATQEAKAAALERIKWLLWHGNAPDAVDDIECLLDDVTAELEDNPISACPRSVMGSALPSRREGDATRLTCRVTLTPPVGPSSHNMRGLPPLEQASPLLRCAALYRRLVAPLLCEFVRADCAGARGRPPRAATSRKLPRFPCSTLLEELIRERVTERFWPAFGVLAVTAVTARITIQIELTILD
jgi:hypothetical protein